MVQPSKTHDRVANPQLCDRNSRMGTENRVQLPIPWLSPAKPMIGQRIHSFATKTLEWAAKLGFSYQFHGFAVKLKIRHRFHSFRSETMQWAAKLGFSYTFHGFCSETQDPAPIPQFFDRNSRMGCETGFQLPILWFSPPKPIIGQRIQSFATENSRMGNTTRVSLPNPWFSHKTLDVVVKLAFCLANPSIYVQNTRMGRGFCLANPWLSHKILE